jgi:hypothetical protein
MITKRIGIDVSYCEIKSQIDLHVNELNIVPKIDYFLKKMHFICLLMNDNKCRNIAIAFIFSLLFRDLTF